jgi:hypothetical protein
MEKLNRSIFAAVALLILMTAFELARPVAIQGETPKDMRVINTPAEPVPTKVQGTVAVSGAVTGVVQSQQSGPWNVGILGVPTIGIDPSQNKVRVINQGSETQLLMDDDYSGMPEGVSTFSNPVDVSPYAKVRVSCTINGSGEIRFRIYSGTGVSGGNSNLRLIETFETDNAWTRVYDVPGVSLHVSMNPSSSVNQALIQMYGH